MPPTIPAGNVHALHVTGDVPDTPRLGLSWIDRLGLEVLATGDVAPVVELARGLAEALAGPERDLVRLRTLGRAIAVTRTQQALLEAMLMERLAKRDVDGVELINKVLHGVANRLVKMLDAHRLESAQQRRVAVVVSHADQVTVEGVG